MPLVKKELTLAAGATSEQILAGTTYEYVGPNTTIIVAAGAGDGAGGIAADDATEVVMNFQVNNAEFTRAGSVSPLVSGEAFGYRGGYVMNDMVTTAVERNRPIVTFTNNSAASRNVQVAIFIGG